MQREIIELISTFWQPNRQRLGCAIEAGQLGYEAGRMPERDYAVASSPMEGLVPN